MTDTRKMSLLTLEFSPVTETQRTM